MQILQINGYESPGRRFNGLAITPVLKKYDIHSKHLIWEKDTNNPNVLTFKETRLKRVNKYIQKIEHYASLQSVLYPHGAQIIKMPEFQNADLIHFHIIHSGYFSLSDLPRITKLKPAVWTLHDPWALTGHCVHPFNCQNWRVECANCPDLKSDFPLLSDNTKILFNYKKKIYQQSKLDVIVASQWMQNMVEASPLFKGFNIHRIPFGIDLKFFSKDAAPNARKRFGIPEHAIVISFRVIEGKFKGLPYILETLDRLNSPEPICIFTTNNKGLQERFADRFQIIELGWTNDEELMRDAFVASDIFLMPSIAEAFGMMAIEAMACSKPIIVFDGTALPEVVFAPDPGISVPMYNVEELVKALERLINNPQERLARGNKSRQIAELHYSDDLQASRLADVYRKVTKK